MGKQRQVYTLLSITAILCLLTIRLLWIQVLNTHHFSKHDIDLVKSSVTQREQGIILDSGRAHFYDRSLQPLTGEQINSLVIFPMDDHFHGSDQLKQELVHALNTSLVNWNQFTDNQQQPQLWIEPKGNKPLALSEQQVQAIRALALPGIRVIPYGMRYAEGEVARHVIGFIAQSADNKIQTGASGLELSFERYLQGAGTTSLSAFRDGKLQPLQGLNIRMNQPDNRYYPLKVVTTLDEPIQREIESFIDKMNLRVGAVVVLDAANADVIAMASRPQFNPYDVDPDQRNWNNRALQEATPGSIFKTVIAAAALEHGVTDPDEMFFCGGKLGNYGFSCWLKEGHGQLTFKEAYAQSCNITFAKVMQRLSSAELLDTAAQLGLLQQQGWSSSKDGDEIFRQFAGEQGGQIFAVTTNREDDGARVQTSIGQRDVRMTPLQAANLVITLLHNGEVKSPRIVREIRYRNDMIKTSFAEQNNRTTSHGISKKTAKQLIDFMGEVVYQGTGKSLQQANWRLAGKSGTAQVIDSNGMMQENEWFIGYGPVDTPRYAVSVMVESVSPAEQQTALQLFQGIMDILAAPRTTLN